MALGYFLIENLTSLDENYKKSDTKFAVVRGDFMTVLQCPSAREKSLWIAAFDSIKSSYSETKWCTPERTTLKSFADSNPGVFAKCKDASPLVQTIAQSYSECEMKLI